MKGFLVVLGLFALVAVALAVSDDDLKGIRTF